MSFRHPVFLSHFKKLIDCVGGERKRNINSLFHSFMHSLVEFWIFPDRGSNLQLQHIGMTL